MRAVGPLAAIGGAIAAAGCEPPTPCDDYVDYMCVCHPDDADCDALSLTYDAASPDVQNECAVLLSDQETADRAAGLTCDPASTTTTSVPTG